MVVRVNGVTRDLPDRSTIEQLLDLFKLAKKSVVFELNQKVVERNSYSVTELKEGDALEIVHFVGGG